MHPAGAGLRSGLLARPAVDGIVHTTLLKRLDIAAERSDKAIASNPNDSLAWLLRSTIYTFKGQGDAP
jgi:adenylate cyclase